MKRIKIHVNLMCALNGLNPAVTFKNNIELIIYIGYLVTHNDTASHIHICMADLFLCWCVKYSFICTKYVI